MEDRLLEVGVGGLVAIMIIRMVLDFLKSKKGESDQKVLRCIEKNCQECLRLQRDLHIWHNVADNEGVKVWYVRRSLEEAITKLSENIGKQTEVLQGMGNAIHTMHNDMKRIHHE